MALAIRLETLVREGVVGNYGDLAEAGQISRARMSQLLRLLKLAPRIPCEPECACAEPLSREGDQRESFPATTASPVVVQLRPTG